MAMQDIRVVRAAAGTSIRAVGARYELVEPKSAFAFPADRAVVVVFDWVGLPGEHALSVVWLQPDGNEIARTPESRITFPTREMFFSASLGLQSYYQPGSWVAEAMIDGRPAGRVTFTLTGVDPTGGRLTPDQVFERYRASVARVRALDADGRAFEDMSGFVITPGELATAFQAIDAAAALEVSFEDGGRATTRTVRRVSRAGDWAIVEVDTGNRSPIPLSTNRPFVGARLHALGVSKTSATLEPVDVVSRFAEGGADRIRYAGEVGPSMVGGPLVDDKGLVVAILGGTLEPGSRLPTSLLRANPSLWITAEDRLATPIDVVDRTPADPQRLDQLMSVGLFTPPIKPAPTFGYGLIIAQRDDKSPVNPEDSRSRREFSLAEGDLIAVFSDWVLTNRPVNGKVSARVVDAGNHLRVDIPAKKVDLVDRQQRLIFTLNPRALGTGRFRVDVYWNEDVAWRAYVRVTE